jgi:RNA polymerase sigma-70 factor (ECF subfamily)
MRLLEAEREERGSDRLEVDASREVLVALIEAHEVRLYRYLVALTGDPETARDCLQDTFTRAYEHLQRGRDVNTQWLYKVGRNRGIDELRRRQRERANEAAVPEFSAASHLEDLVGLRLAFRDLAPDDRAILSLVVVEGLTGEEIAERLGIRLGAVRTRLYRARERFRAIYTGGKR